MANKQEFFYLDAAEAKSRIDQAFVNPAYSDWKEAYFSKSHPDHKQAVDEFQELHEWANNTIPEEQMRSDFNRQAANDDWRMSQEESVQVLKQFGDVNSDLVKDYFDKSRPMHGAAVSAVNNALSLKNAEQPMTDFKAELAAGQVEQNNQDVVANSLATEPASQFIQVDVDNG